MDTKSLQFLRQLARSDDYQNLYILSKEIGSIRLLENTRDFTFVQNVFLRYLNFYYTLFSDIAIGDVDEIVLEDDIYSDSYMMYKNKQDKEKFKNKKIQRSGETMNSLHTNQWIFKSKNKTGQVKT
jgi:hypothetical protein